MLPFYVNELLSQHTIELKKTDNGPHLEKYHLQIHNRLFCVVGLSAF